jgi:outer membrane protein OmpA-like peptidoglycan-associated protein
MILKLKIMLFNLIDSVRGLLGADLVPKASARLHDDETRIQYAMSGIVPAVLAGIIHKAGSGDAGRMLAMAKDTANSNMLSNIGNFLSDNMLLERGTDLLKGIFGGHMHDVVNQVSNYSGIKSSSSAALMSMTAPAALGAIGVQANSTNMDERSFLSYLEGQKESVLNALPSGLNLTGALGLSSIGNVGTRITGATTHARDVDHNMRRKPSTNWVMPVIVIAAALGLVFYFSTLNSNRSEDTAVVTKPEPGRIAAPPPTGATVRVKLPNGVELNAYRNGIESQLVNFLNDPAKRVDDNIWFDFDKLNFEPGSSMITSESVMQIKNIAAILKAYPNASIKIGGYTDATGNEAANLKLSQARAEAVVAELRSNGIPESQLAGAEGYGSKFAKAAASASDEERKRDRRISVSVRKK